MQSCRGGRRPPAPAHVRRRAGSRKSSPACRCPTCWGRFETRVRHRARRGRRLPPAHAGSNSPSAPETPVGIEQPGRAGRSARRTGSKSSSTLSRLRFAAAPAARVLPANRACRLPAVQTAGSAISGAASGSTTVSSTSTASAGASRPSRSRSRADNCRASSLKALVFDRRQRRRFGLADRAERQNVLRRFRRHFHGVSTGVSKSVCCEVSDAIGSVNSAAKATQHWDRSKHPRRPRLRRSSFPEAILLETSLLEASLREARFLEARFLQPSPRPANLERASAEFGKSGTDKSC